MPVVGKWASAAIAALAWGIGSVRAADLMAGAKWEYSTDDGARWGAVPPVVPGGRVAPILAKTSFDLPDLSAFAALELTQNVPPEQKTVFDLNSQPLPVPQKGMVCKTVPAIPPEAFRKGKNELSARIAFDNRPKKADDPVPDPATVALEVSLAGLQPSDLRMHTGPVLGAVTETSFNATCRASIPPSRSSIASRVLFTASTNWPSAVAAG